MAAATGGSDNSSDVQYTDDIQQPLDEFVCTHTLPQSVSVTRGSFMSPDAMIVRGDVLLVRAIAPTSISLSFADPDSGLKREIVVSPDIPVKFLALPPKDSILSDPDSADNGTGRRPISIVTYPTIADLLLDCPTYFEANSTYDDPYLPGFSVKPGDKFRFVKVVRDVSGDRTERLQCQTESGQLVCLSSRCKGNFTVLNDDISYTLRELTDLARVPRRLKLAPENQDFKVPSCDGSVAQLSEIPLSFSGVFTMSRPEEKLEVSPWNSPETTWHVPVDSNLHVRLYSATDYEEPVVSRRIKHEPLTTFVSEHEHKFPVHATLFTYTTPPQVISSCLRDSRDIIVHKSVHTQKLFVKDSRKDEYFAIDQSVDISFVEIPRTLSSIFEMMSLPLGSQVRVLADIAADFPEPFILRYGDVLKVIRHDSSSWKFKHSSTGDVPIVKCERMLPGGKAQKLKLPLDLDVSLVLMSDPSQLRVTKLAKIFSGEEDILIGNVSVLEGNGGSYSPLPSSLQILQVLTEKELLISPLNTTAAISPRIKTCVKIPLRHQVQLGLKRKLEFPDGYFIMPPNDHVVSLGIEPVQESEYEELVRAMKIATEYEDVEIVHRERDEDTRSQASSTGRSRYAVSSESMQRSTSTGTLERKRHKDRVRRISRVLNPKNWRLGRTAAGDQEELPPPDPPVSGIMTLSLQPPQAAANDYTGDMGEGSGTGHPQQSLHQRTESEDVEDDPYEAVNVTPGMQLATSSRSMQPEHAERLAPSVDSSTHLSASADKVKRAAAAPASRAPQCSVNENISSPAEAADGAPPSCEELEPDQPRQRRKREEDSEGTPKGTGRRRRRKTEPGITWVKEEPKKPLSPDCERKSREHLKASEACEEDLERAPPIRHTRGPAPAVDTPERSRKMQSPDKSTNKSHHLLKGSVGAEIPITYDRKKTAQSNEDSSGKEHHRNKTQALDKEPEKPGRHKESSTAERERKTQSSNHPSDSSPALEKRKKRQSPDHPSDISPALERRRKTPSPDHPSQHSPAANRRRKMQSPDQPVEISHVPERQGKPLPPDCPLEHYPVPERRRKIQSPNTRLAHSPALEGRKNMDASDDSVEKTSSKSTEFASPEFQSKHSNLVESTQASKSPNSSLRQEKTERSRKSPSSDNPSEHSQNKAGKPRSPEDNSSGALRRQRKKQSSDDDLKQRSDRDPASQSPRTFGELPTESAAEEMPRQPKGGEDSTFSPERPRRQRRKQDTSSELQGDESVDAQDAGSKGSDSCSTIKARSSPRIPETVPKRDKAVHEKPAIPPKPAISPGAGTSHGARVAKGAPPVVPPRKRGARVGSVEAEMYSEGADVKPVLGRRRTP